MTTEPLDSTSLAAIAPLREAGFAVHWLHPKTKRPIGKDWQNTPVPTLAELQRTHQPGNNLGVRLGEPSRTSAGYLQALDLDIRLPDLAHEAWDALRALLPGVDIDSLPCVASGSGGESRHLYFVTEKPFFGRKIAVSEGKHRRETADATTGEIKEVWSYDWEIELFGTGKQVAMPPSIHPDTGRPYTWEREFDLTLMDLGIGPAIPADTIEALGVAETTTYAFESREPLTYTPGQMERDLAAIPLHRIDDYADWVTLGQALHHQFGGSDAGFEIWVAQSKRSEKFALNGKRDMLQKWRGFGRNRRQPVTMASVRVWAMEGRAAALRNQFDEEDDGFEDEADPLDDGDDTDAVDPLDDILGGDTPAPKPAAAKPASIDDMDEFTGGEAPAPRDDDWISLLDLNEEGAIKPTLHNVRLIVEHDAWTSGVPAFNEFTQEIVQRAAPGKKAQRRGKNAVKKTLQLDGPNWVMRDPINGDFWTDDKDNAIRALIEAPKTQGGWGIKVPDRDLKAAIDIAGRKNGFHPVREYLSGLVWDGVSRCETLFIDYVGAPDDSYHRAVGRLMMTAAVTRVFEPGHKFDFSVILEGMQGKRKSTFIETLAKSWFSTLDGDFEDTKVMVEAMQGAWILEIPELSGFAKADVRHIKAFISRTTDKVRLAYARRAQEFPRQCIYVGSTNDDTYLKDDTGGRRWWPVRCTADNIDTDRLAANVDQMWAEAVVRYREMRAAKPHGNLPLYLADDDARVIAERLQESRRIENADDALAGQIAEWLERPINNGGIDEAEDGGLRQEVCLIQIWCECLGKDTAGYVGAWPSTLGRAMKQVPGWSMTGARSRFGKYGQQRSYQRD